MTIEVPGERPFRRLLLLFALFMLALLPRLYSAWTVGWSWDHPGSFTLVNFDEAGSCRAALDGFEYSSFIGRQTIAIADWMGRGPEPGIAGDDGLVKSYCHSPVHITIARTYSAIAGALTVMAVAVIALQLVPTQPRVAWIAGVLLALSGFHMSESHSGTVDAASVFFIYAFLALMVCAVRARWRLRYAFTALLLVPAIWAKYWVFALFSYLALTPGRWWRYLTHGISPQRVVVVVVASCLMAGILTNTAMRQAGLLPLAALFYLVIPWRRVHRPMAALWLLLPLLVFALSRVDIIATYTSGGMHGRFGTSYGAIGWHKWLRNLLNVPLVLLLGLGLPACLFLPAGIRAIARGGREHSRAWLCLLPLLVFALFMLFLAPVTYYRHYLALIPGAAIVAAYGLVMSRWIESRWFMSLFLLWPALLAIDLEADYHTDPRIELRQWYARHPDARVFMSYYVNPPASGMRRSRIFRPEYAQGEGAVLRQADYLVLSENWYDTAFANELNGPLVGTAERLVKTRPEYVRFYRQALAGGDARLAPELALEVHNFMPEPVFHKWWYGSFQLFVGDIRIFRVVD